MQWNFSSEGYSDTPTKNQRIASEDIDYEEAPITVEG